MVICKIWDADYPWDVRVEKVCRSLTQKYPVHLVCRNTKCLPPSEELDGIHVHRLPCLRGNFRNLNYVAGFPVFFNPLWLYVVAKTIRQSGARLILVRDLPLALTAIMLGRCLRIPVVLDMAENYPAMIRDLWSSQGFRLRNFFVRNPILVSLVEKICVRYADHVLVVVEESRKRLLDLGVPAEKISVVMNTPTLERWSKISPRLCGGVAKEPGDLVLIYLGLLELPRGLETAVRGVAEVRRRLPNVRLLILGTGRDEGYFKSLVAELDLGDHVQFLGWVEYTEAIAYIASADIGVVPHHATDSWNTTIPNKLFDYMSMGKPVVVSNAEPTERIVKEEKCGVVFEERNPKDFADAIVALSDEHVRTAQGKRGRDAVERKYNWSRDEERLFRAIEMVTPLRRCR